MTDERPIILRAEHISKSFGAVTDKYSFAPILLGASAAPVLAAIVVFTLVRNTKNTGNGVLLRI